MLRRRLPGLRRCPHTPKAARVRTDPSGQDRSHSLSLHRLAGFDYADPDHAYLVTICSRHTTAPFTDARLAGEVVASLDWLRAHRALLLSAWCLMLDHLHLLLRPGDRQRHVGALIGAFKSFTTRQSWRLGYHGQLWHARYYDHMVRRSEDGGRIAQYILENPVRKGLVGEADAYPWSGMPDPL
jgi:putative transposase